MNDQLPAVLPSGAIAPANSTDTYVVPALIADAGDPLYKTLDEGQKRRFAILTRHGRFFGGGDRYRRADRGSEPGMNRKG